MTKEAEKPSDNLFSKKKIVINTGANIDQMGDVLKNIPSEASQLIQNIISDNEYIKNRGKGVESFYDNLPVEAPDLVRKLLDISEEKIKEKKNEPIINNDFDINLLVGFGDLSPTEKKVNLPEEKKDSVPTKTPPPPPPVKKVENKEIQPLPPQKNANTPQLAPPKKPDESTGMTRAKTSGITPPPPLHKPVPKTTITTPKPVIDWTIYESGSILGIKINKSTKDDVVEIMKNYSKQNVYAKGQTELKYEDLGLIFTFKTGGLLQEINIYPPYRGRTSKGLRLEDSIELALNFYGSPKMRSRSSAIWKNIAVFLEDDLVTGIRLRED